MIAEHDGRNVPVLSADWDSSDRDTVFFDWAPMLGGAEIVSSEWEVPFGWSVDQAFTAQRIRVMGEEYIANGVLLSAPADSGLQLISNTVTLSDGRSYQRSAYVPLEEI